MLDPTRFITDRLRRIDASGIRRVFDLAAKLDNPINLSIGQPDFDVPEPIKQAAIDAIQAGRNQYTVTQGIQPLRDKVTAAVADELPNWKSGLENGDLGVLITSGVSGGLVLAMLTCVGPGDEVLIPDPYFVMYRYLVTLAGATPVYVDTYPDFQLTAQRIEPHITPRTKLLMFNSPSNPTGVVANASVCKQVAELAQKHNLLILSDEIYNAFWYDRAVSTDGADAICPTPAQHSTDVLLMRGFSKTYGMTGWRLGYLVGPSAIVEQLTKLQQYSFVCAPSMVQHAGTAAMSLDACEFVDAYRRKRDLTVDRLKEKFTLTTPGGAFYIFPQTPEHLNLTGSQFVERALEHQVLMIPGGVFSSRDTHFRISYACSEDQLNRGIDVLLKLAP